MANIEIKPAPGTDLETGRAVARLAAALWEGAPVAPLLSSFSAEALMAAREEAPGASPRAASSGSPATPTSAACASSSAVSLHCSRKAAIAGTGRARARRGLPAPGLDGERRRPRPKRLLAWGVDGIITDNLREFASRFPELL